MRAGRKDGRKDGRTEGKAVGWSERAHSTATAVPSLTPARSSRMPICGERERRVQAMREQHTNVTKGACEGGSAHAIGG